MTEELKREFPDAFSFFAGHFFQGFIFMNSDPEEVIDNFLMTSDSEWLEKVVENLRRIAKTFYAEDIDKIICGLDCDFDPYRFYGIPADEWLAHVIGRIEGHLTGTSSEPASTCDP